MTSHELAKILLENDNLPVATHACNHTYASGTDSNSHGPLKVGLLQYGDIEHIIIGNISQRDINAPNWYVTKMIHGDAPEHRRGYQK